MFMIMSHFIKITTKLMQRLSETAVQNEKDGLDIFKNMLTKSKFIQSFLSSFFIIPAKS